MNRIFPKLLLLLILSGCSKSDFLDKKPSSNIVIPTTLEELQGLLDNESIMVITPGLVVQSADEYYWNYTDWQAQLPKQRNAYTWESNIYKDASITSLVDWDALFKQVFYANIVLDGVEKIAITPTNQQQWRRIKGSALFTRAKAWFSLAEVFTLPYDISTAKTDLGLPMRLKPDITAPVSRSTLQETYDQILADLNQAKGLLDSKVIEANRIRPTKLTAYGLLARVSLVMRNYDSAGNYADSLLQNYNKLMDYNGMTTFPVANDEVIYQNSIMNQELTSIFGIASGIMRIDSTLYATYSPNDLRRTLSLKTVNGRVTFGRSYSGLIQPFSGIATDEMYLIRAECNARKGELLKAANDINDLLVKRYKTNTYTKISYSSTEVALPQILLERRKELLLRGARWSDVRRLNKEGYNIYMKRLLNGTEYSIAPNDSRFAILIPEYEIKLSGIQQNLR